MSSETLTPVWIMSARIGWVQAADALPSGDSVLRASVGEFMRPMLSPALAALNRDTFSCDEHNETTVDLHAHRATSDLDELDLDDEQTAEAA